MHPLSLITLALTAAASAQPCVEHLEKDLQPNGGQNNHFGWACAMSVDVAVASSPWDPVFAPLGGSADVFRVVGGQWQHDQQLGGGYIQEGDNFGSSLAALPTVIAVGARGDDQQDINAGAVYMYRHNGYNWNLEQKLVASDGGWQHSLGNSVSLTHNGVIGGAPYDNANGTNSGSAYVFSHDGSGWTDETKLLAYDGAPGHLFGYAVAISGPLAVVGAPSAPGNEWGTGKAYVYRHDGSAWQFEAELTAADGQTNDVFGWSVAAFGDTVLVGAPGDWDHGSNAGTAFVFRFDGSVWHQEAKLLPDSVGTADHYGYYVSLSGQVAATAGSSNTVYVHYGDPQTGQWDLIAEKQRPGAHGACVSVRNASIIAGAPSDSNANGADAGAVHFYGLADSCPGDFNGDCHTDTQDVIDFLNAWVAQDPEADVNDDDAVDTLDMIRFLNEWSGC